MKKPLKPPKLDDILANATKSPEVLEKIFISSLEPLGGETYYHWDQLYHMTPPAGFSREEWWLAIKFKRAAFYKDIPLKDVSGQAFKYAATADPIPEIVHRVDMSLGGRIEMEPQITNPETRDRYYVSSLMEEAITSSQLEGAATTRRVAKNMIRSGRKPANRHERMILNNYLTMREIGGFKDEPLTRELVFEIHKLITQNTLDDPQAAGRFRKSSEDIAVCDEKGTVLHYPPHASELDGRMEMMCEFANRAERAGEFMHPVIRSIILHFWLAYDHPFCDGNGRVARALLYWSMLHHGYWLFEFISISSVIHEGPSKYHRAFLYTETDDNDLTYFIIYHLELINRAIDSLHEYISRKSEELAALERELKGFPQLNHRQKALVAHALKHPDYRYTIKEHQSTHNVVYETARSDLLALSGLGILELSKGGKKLYFAPCADLESRLKELS